MKKLFVLPFFAVFPTFAGQVADLTSLLQTIDDNNVSEMEEVIPLLPESMRGNFTLQYHGNGLQEASFENPRAILFSNDGKFILTFNGDPLQTKYNSFEILQFKDSTKTFELYELEFPIARDAAGKAVVPAKNPQACTTCHGTDPHPIWGRYNFWAGFYGEHDDKLLAAELTPFADFMAARLLHPRYKHLIPAEGSDLSPFSSPAVETKTFRPNLVIGSLLTRLNSMKAADQVKQSVDGLKYFLLISPLMYQCDSHFSYQEKQQLELAMKTIFIERGFTALPHPNRKSYDADNVVYLLGGTLGQWGMGSEQNASGIGDAMFLDNILMTTPNYVLAALKTEFYAQYPALTGFTDPFLQTSLSTNPRLVQTQRDLNILIQLDQLLVPERPGAGANCDVYHQTVLSELL